MDAKEYKKATEYLDKKKAFNEVARQTTENTKIIKTNKASIKYILNEW